MYSVRFHEKHEVTLKVAQIGQKHEVFCEFYRKAASVASEACETVVL